MSNVLSVLATRDAIQNTVSLFKVDAKTAREYVRKHSQASSSFIETIADIDNAHFMTMYEMRDLVNLLKTGETMGAVRDRLQAAKELAKALRERQDFLPAFEETKKVEGAVRFFPPSSVIKPCRKGTKKAIFVELMLRGTTVAELMAAVGWKEASIHTGFNYDINKIHGFGYTIENRDGVNYYKLVVPATHTGPVIV